MRYPVAGELVVATCKAAAYKDTHVNDGRVLIQPGERLIVLGESATPWTRVLRQDGSVLEVSYHHLSMWMFDENLGSAFEGL